MEKVAESISSTAKELGERYGNVVVRERSGHTLFTENLVTDSPRKAEPEYELFLSNGCTEFMYTSSSAIELIQPGPANGHQRSQAALQKLKNLELYDRPDTRERLSQLGAPVLSFAGVEYVTTSLWQSAIGSLAGYGLHKLHARAEKRARHREYVHDIHQGLKSIAQELKTPEAVVRLSNDAEPVYLSSENLELLSGQDISVAGSPSLTLKTTDILDWLEANIPQERVDVSLNRGDWLGQTSLTVPELTVRLGTSLWSLVKENVKAKNTLSTSENDVEQAILEFKSSRDELAMSLGLPLQPAALDADNVGLHWKRESRVGFDAKYQQDWLDIPLSIISLAPGVIVHKLLKHDPIPNELWQIIAPDAAQLQQNHAQQQTLETDIRYTRSRAQLAGVDTPESVHQVAELEKEAQALEQENFVLILGMVGAAVIRDRRRRYDAMRDELITSFGETIKAEDQFGAIRLFDEAINALVQNVKPDSELAIQISQDLRGYLKSAAPFIDGSLLAYAQLYEGMRLKFPALKLKVLE